MFGEFGHLHRAVTGRCIGINLAKTVGSDKRTDDVAIIQHPRDAADAARPAAGPCAEPGTDGPVAVAPQLPGRRKGLARQPAIGWVHAPRLVATIGDVEQDRSRYHRNRRQAVAHRQAPPGGGEQQRQLIAGRQPEHRTAGQRQPVGAFDQVDGVQCIRLARAGPAAAHVHRHHGGFAGQDQGNAGARHIAMGMADVYAGNRADA